MGRIKTALGLAPKVAEIQQGITASIYSGGGYDVSRMPFASPWSTSNLERWAYEEWFGQSPLTTRDAAMAIPALFRGRNQVCISAGKQPLVELEGDTPVADQPYWITHTPDGSTPLGRMLWTVDDLIFHGMSLWWRSNTGKADETRQRINWDEWELNRERRQVLVNGEDVKPEEVILIIGAHEGILNGPGRTFIGDTTKLYENVRQRLDNPVPAIDLHQTEGEALTKTQKDELLDDWRAARLDKTKGGVAFSSKSIEVRELGLGVDQSLMIEARNAAAVDAARLVGLHAGKVDATTPKASLDYTTQTGRNEEFVDFDLDLYILPIIARLSLDDVCAPGRRIAVDTADFTSLTPSPTGPTLED